MVAYLSRIYLNPLRTGAQKMLRSPQVVHAAVLGGLSRQPVDERVLWRLEVDSPHRLALLVLTRSRPSWESVVEQAGWASSDDPQALVKPYDALLGRIVLGRELAFRLRVNPVTATRAPERPSPKQQERLAAPGRGRGVLVPERTAAQQSQWFARHTRAWGFEVPDNQLGAPSFQLVDRQRTTFSRGGGSGRVTLLTATFEGRLRVTDAERLRDSLLDGVGRARAYGCGLLTLAALSEA